MKWEKKPLTDFVLFQRGFDLPREKFIDGEFPVVGSTSILGYHKEAKVKAPGIVTGRSGTIGQFQFLKQDFWPHNTSLWVKDFKGNNEKFAYYLLHTLDFISLNGGGAVPTLNRNFLSSINVNVPKLYIQQKIASILSAYDDLIENNLKRIRLLEEKALIEYNYLKSELKLSRNEKIKLKDTLDFKYGKALKADDRTGEGYPVYGSSGIVGKHKDYLVTGPGIVVGRKGNVGSVFWSFDNFWVIDTAYFITSDISLYYLYFNLREQSFVNTDAAVPGLNRNFALDNFIYLPPISSILEFEEKIKPMFNLIHNLQNQNTKLREARDILLPRLMSGEIGV